MYAIGISIGGCLLLRYAGKKKENCKLKGIVALANPYDLLLGAKMISHSPVWDYFITHNLKKVVKNNYDILKTAPKELEVDLDRALKARSTAAFDEYFTRRINGYPTRDSYYRAVHCTDVLQDIKVPTLCINSLDDPTTQEKIIPKDDFRKNENLMLVLTQKGGHIDWFSSRKAVRVIFLMLCPNNL